MKTITQFKGLTLAVISFSLQLLTLNGIAQDMHFSQFYQTPLLINPSLTGAFNGDLRVIINHKDQWRSLVSPFATSLFSFDTKLFKNKWKNSYLGLGVYAATDKAGDNELKTTLFGLSLSSIISLNTSHKIAVGLQGGYAQRSINANNMQWGSQFNGEIFDPSIQSGEIVNFNKCSFGDFSSGASWNYGADNANLASHNEFRMNLGVAYTHLSRPDRTFLATAEDKMYSKMVVHASSYIGISYTALALVPSILFTQQGTAREYNLGTMVRYQVKEESRYTELIKEVAVFLGGYYRLGDAFIPTFAFEMANFSVGLSYDVTTSKLREVSNGRGGVEVSLRYINPNPFRNDKSGSNKTVRFL